MIKRENVRATRLKSSDVAKIDAAMRVVAGTRAEFVRGAALRLAEATVR